MSALDNFKTIRLDKRVLLGMFLFPVILGLLTALVITVYGVLTFKPTQIYITNITPSSATVSWVTDSRTKGTALVLENPPFLPFSVNPLKSSLHFDDRDWSVAEIRAAESKISRRTDKSVSYQDIISKIFLPNLGNYQTHHVTIRNLEPSTRYHLMLGNGAYHKKVEFSTEFAFATTAETSELQTPQPAYGLVRSNGTNIPIKDAIVYLIIEDQKDGNRSNMISAVLADNGSWYLDLTSATDASGKPFLNQYMRLKDLDHYLIIEAADYGRFSKYVPIDKNSPAETIYLGDLKGGENKYDLNYLGSSTLRSALPALSFRSHASGCPEGSYEGCHASCLSGCPRSDHPDACAAGCENACRSMCSEEFQRQSACNTCDGFGLGTTRCVTEDNRIHRCDSNGEVCFWQQTSEQCSSDPIAEDPMVEEEVEVIASDVTPNVIMRRCYREEQKKITQSRNLMQNHEYQDFPNECPSGWEDAADLVTNKTNGKEEIKYVCCDLPSAGQTTMQTNCPEDQHYIYDGECATEVVQAIEVEDHVNQNTETNNPTNDMSPSFLFQNLISKVHAQSLNESGSIMLDPVTSTYIFQEEGVYRFIHQGSLYEVNIENIDSHFVIYIDMNNNQMYDLDIDQIVAEDPVEISFEKVSDIINYQLARNFNFVSFDFMPEGFKPTSEEVLEYLNTKYDNSFFSISKFDASTQKWQITGARDGVTYGTSKFHITPGTGYVLRSSKPINIEMSGFKVKDPVPVSLMSGWNLIALHGGNSSYTAQGLLEEMRTEGIEANNVSKWETSKSRYEGLQITPDQTGTDQVYGYDYPLNLQNAYFVRVLQGKDRWTPK